MPKGPRDAAKPRQILLSKRANVFYLEHVRIMQKDGRIVYLTNGERGDELDYFFNVPERNTAFILLGKGSSITDAAARRMAESNVVVGFVGNGGSPLFSTIDAAFLVPQSEYRPTEYMQGWARMWLDEAKRLAVAKAFFAARLQWLDQAWGANSFLLAARISLSQAVSPESFAVRAAACPDTGSLMALEGELAKRLYGLLARTIGGEFARREGNAEKATVVGCVNSFLDHGNYIAYGYAATALNALGISFAFPVMHGKTRRGALVFDVADLCKDALVMPLAFEAGARSWTDQAFRDAVIEAFHSADAMDRMIDSIKAACAQ